MKKAFIVLVIFLVLAAVVSYFWLSPFSVDTDHDIFPQSAINISDIEEKKSSEISKRLDSILLNSMRLNDFVGVSTGVYYEGFGTWLATSGYKNFGTKTTPDENTQFRLASISKPMTAVAIMQLFEKGKVELDKPISTYLKDFKNNEKGKITIRQLLNHTSGVPHYTSTWDAISFTQYDSMTQAIDVFKNRALSFEPGTSYEYTTFGYTVLGAIIEHVSGLRYQDYMKDYIWTPLQMIDTSVEDKDETYSNKAELYVKLKDKYVTSPKTNLSVKYPGGGIQSTAADLIKFGKGILNNTLLDSTTMELMFSIPDTVQKEDYRFGWKTSKHPDNGRIIEHGGSQAGASSFLKIYLDKKIVAPVIANNTYSDNEVYFLSRDLANFFLDTTSYSKPTHVYAFIDEYIIKDFVGDYQKGDKKFSVTLDDNLLHGQLHPYPRSPFFSKSDTTFFSRYFDGQLSFKEIDGRIESLEYTYEGNVEVYKKLK